MLVNNILHSLCARFDDAPGIGKERLQAMLFLLAWKTSLQPTFEVSQLDWVFSPKGPTSARFEQILQTDPRYILTNIIVDGSTKTRVSLKDKMVDYTLDPQLITAINEIYILTVSKNFNELMDLVFSTYPILISEINEHLDLPQLARQYLTQKHLSS